MGPIFKKSTLTFLLNAIAVSIMFIFNVIVAPNHFNMIITIVGVGLLQFFTGILIGYWEKMEEQVGQLLERLPSWSYFPILLVSVGMIFILPLATLMIEVWVLNALLGLKVVIENYFVAFIIQWIVAVGYVLLFKESTKQKRKPKY